MNKIPKEEVELLHKPFVTFSSAEQGKEREMAVRVGRIPHPMEENHYIEWIELYQNGELINKISFDPKIDREAKAYFSISLGENLNFEVKAKCNLHGVWSTLINEETIKDIEVD